VPTPPHRDPQWLMMRACHRWASQPAAARLSTPPHLHATAVLVPAAAHLCRCPVHALTAYMQCYCTCLQQQQGRGPGLNRSRDRCSARPWLQPHHQVLNVTVPAHRDWLLLCRVLLAENPANTQGTCTGDSQLQQLPSSHGSK
jgi:hypothetical protein